MVIVFALTIFLSAFLLFQIEPLIAKYILPWFGGTPAVWSTCMLFFQILLLAGYVYSHVLCSRAKLRTHRSIHPAVLLLSIALLMFLTIYWRTPITPGDSWKAQGSGMPILNVLLILTISVGAPFFVLATTSPLLQRWFSVRYPNRSPYRLFGLSNAGSLVALLSYPFLIEPAFRLTTQAWMWSGLYAVFALMCAGIAIAATRENVKSPGGAAEDCGEAEAALPGTGWVDAGASHTGADWRLKALWVLLSAGPSAVLLATTNQMCQEVAVIPFLWIVPLSLYLVTFILCFGHERLYTRWVIPVFVALACTMLYVLVERSSMDILWQVAIFSATMFFACFMCHGELVRLKPHPMYLTSFYLCVSIGGALGGVFVAIAAPSIFREFWELPIGMVLCLVLVLYAIYRDERSWFFGKKVLFVSAVAVICVAVSGSMIYYFSEQSGVLYKYRNFFGILSVKTWENKKTGDEFVELVHGRIIHGTEYKDPARWMVPTTYYSPESGLGMLFQFHPDRRGDEKKPWRIGAVGLGAGTIAAYGERGDYLRFYEINPKVVSLARGEGGYFHYLPECKADVDVALGDARLSLERELGETGTMDYDLLILDAFSSDSIPLHLLTEEAFELYLEHLKPDGVIAVHVSNRHLRVNVTAWKIAEHFGFHAVEIRVDDPGENGGYRSDWVLLTHDEGLFDLDEFAERAKAKPEDLDRYSLWTDDYSNLFEYLR